MTIQEAAKYLITKLENRYGIREATNMVSLLFEDAYGISNLHKSEDFSGADKLEKVGEELYAGKPVQYITETAHFYGYQFYVNPSVLIPRPETEELVHTILSDYSSDRRQRDVLDIGSGSGCIPISLKKKNADFRVFGIEYSIDAFNVARINAKNMGAPVQFYRSDFLDESLWSEYGVFDIIVSNPPYIDPEEKKVMADNVLLYEPEMALFVEEDPLLFYNKIALFSKNHLAPEGKIYVEINQYRTDETLSVFRNTGFEAEVKKDLQGNNRIIKAWW